MHLPMNSPGRQSPLILRVGRVAICLLLAGTACDRDAPSRPKDNEGSVAP
ncbi:MAG: hypothetical protein AVDCRST_MAG89-3107 [uncultured Gemmatimonadetes bacterium]|uniref:Uncharacterized protein n=1 Tax=uncultured Gemmatimonadota bacterium TaxID=203437 RepID=A0A6J4M7R5_9BACT|nr:MAG: hypothetical protein AVDCRST_MAG89-3107 [uncultured Gemmatimonadota bacterium]